jgi:hypothetical protein
MMNFPDLTPVPADDPALVTDQLRLAVVAYLVGLDYSIVLGGPA